MRRIQSVMVPKNGNNTGELKFRLINNKNPTNELKVGGTSMISFDNLSFRITNQLADNRVLGHWSKYTITGKSGPHTIIINCYCLVISNSPGSVYSQHLAYMSENKDKIPARIVCR